jgi:hypothetical protein
MATKWTGFVNSLSARDLAMLYDECHVRMSSDLEELPNGLTPGENYLLALGHKADAINLVRARKHWKMLDTMDFMDTVIPLPLEV